MQLIYFLPQRRSRKRKAQPDKWQRNVRKKLRQNGKTYQDAAGNQKPARCLKNCNCKHLKTFKSYFQCNIVENHQEEINSQIWLFSDSEKDHYFGRTTELLIKKRTRKLSGEESSRRQFSFRYFFIVQDVKSKVCLPCYTSTLDISAKTNRVLLGKETSSEHWNTSR